MTTDKYAPTTAFEAFGRVMTVDEVCKEVPLMLCMDGPRQGWVFDMRASRESSDGSEFKSMFGTVTYEYRAQLVRAEDGRLMREMWVQSRLAESVAEYLRVMEEQR